MSGDDIAFLSAVEAGRLIAQREVSPVELTRCALARIDRLDGHLRSFITALPERALAEARAAELEIAAGGARGPLHGVPMALKDIFDIAGLTTTAGARILADNVPTRDSQVVARLRAAGAVLLGKLNMHELAYGTTTANPHFGIARNPWNLDHSPGGSSGGSGAALAAGLCYLSLGTDTGGSIRIPAAACAIVGLKPTFGRVSRAGVWPLAWALDHVGPMTRTVEDAAIVLDVIAGHDPEDAWSATAPVADARRGLDGGVRGMRLGIPRAYFFEDLDPEVGAAVDAALEVYSAEGATLVEVDIPHAWQAQTALHAILAAEASAQHERWLRERPHDYGEDVRRGLELGFTISAVDYVNSRRMQQLIRREFLAALDVADVLITPALPRTAPAIGVAVSREPRAAWNRLLTPLNLAGLPAAAIPCGFGQGDLPIGLQIIGPAFAEPTVLRVARAYERATDWHRRRPALAVGV